jgi:hypothetical protein
MPAISGQKRASGGGRPRSTAPPGECVLSRGGGTAHSPETMDVPEQMCGFLAAGSEPTIAAAGAAATGPRVHAGPAAAELMP